MRLIDADALLDEFLNRYTERERDGNLVFAACEIKQDFADMISNVPTVEVATVRQEVSEMKVGYISRRRDENGKETFKYREGNATRRIGTRSDTIKVNFLYGTTPYEEVKRYTEFMAEGNLVVVQELFFTNDVLKERLEKWCEWANSCEHREYSLFGEVGE